MGDDDIDRIIEEELLSSDEDGKPSPPGSGDQSRRRKRKRRGKARRSSPSPAGDRNADAFVGGLPNEPSPSITRSSRPPADAGGAKGALSAVIGVICLISVVARVGSCVSRTQRESRARRAVVDAKEEMRGFMQELEGIVIASCRAELLKATSGGVEFIGKEDFRDLPGGNARITGRLRVRESGRGLQWTADMRQNNRHEIRAGCLSIKVDASGPQEKRTVTGQLNCGG